MEIVDPRIADYVERMSSPHEPLLAELSAETRETQTGSGMLTGPVAGRFLELLVWAAQPQRVLDRSPHGERIRLHVGPALETIARLDGSFDFVFIDADKDGYVDYYEAVLPRLAERGLIVADNTLWSGQVVNDAGGPIARFNEHVAGDPRSVSVILPVRDGMTLIRRRSG